MKIEELALPDSLDAATNENASRDTAVNVADFSRAATVLAEVEALTYGSRDLVRQPAEWLLEFQENPTRVFVIRDSESSSSSSSDSGDSGDSGDSDIIAVGLFEPEQRVPASAAWVMVSVLASHRNRGFGTALLSHLEALAANAGMSKLIVYAPSAGGVRAPVRVAGAEPSDYDGLLVPPTGFGALPPDNPEVTFLRSHGYRLEQIIRTSRLVLPVNLGSRLSDAIAAASPDYALHRWIDTTPERWRADIAMLRTRMSLEDPSAGIEEPEDPWTIERLEEADSHLEGATRSRIVTAVEHAASGLLIGYTAILSPRDSDRAAVQDDLLVLPEHRGHRLGMLLKLANLDFLQESRPGHPSIITFNAEENRPMLDVNEDVGFVPLGFEGAWRKDLR
jgi:GNAT superfamily N-acetyltransferase